MYTGGIVILTQHIYLKSLFDELNILYYMIGMFDNFELSNAVFHPLDIKAGHVLRYWGLYNDLISIMS